MVSGMYTGGITDNASRTKTGLLVVAGGLLFVVHCGRECVSNWLRGRNGIIIHGSRCIIVSMNFSRLVKQSWRRAFRQSGMR